MMNKTGIWLDREKAYIIRLTDSGETMEIVLSHLEFFHPSGGSRTRNAKWGPQDVVQDSKYLEREKHQLKKYFSELATRVRDAEALVLFGPGGTCNQFRKELLAHHNALAGKVRAVHKTDSLTENQTRALVREYFQNGN